MDKDIFELVNGKSSIVTTIQAYLEVTRKGSGYVAVCPFHNDTNPSMSINPSMNIFKCFVCNVGGNPISFVKKYNDLTRSISWAEAIQITARINNVVLPKNEYERLYESAKVDLPDESKALDDLASFYRMELKSQAGIRAMEYLRNRKIEDDAIEHFGIGYAPSDNTLAIRTLRERKGYDVETLDRAGIISANSQSLNDRYSERIMFPLKDRNGHTVGFSGRKYLPDDPSTSKYINTPETELFKKGTILYNQDNASATCKKDGYVYVVEGYMDVIALYRAGINSAVALMGTNITEDHMSILKSLRVEIRLCLDSDNPGREATRKWLVPLTNHQIPFKVVRHFDVEKEGKDADEVLDSKGKEYLLRKLDDVLDPISYSVGNLRHDSSFLKNLDTVIAKLSPNYAFLSESECLVLEKFLSEQSGIDGKDFHARLSSANKLPFRQNETVQRASERLDLGYRFEDRFSCQDKLMKLARRKEIRGNISDTTLYSEAQIICRLPLDYEAARMVDTYNFRFSSAVMRLIAKYLMEQYSKEDMDIGKGLDDKMLDDAKMEIVKRNIEQKDDGIQPLLDDEELDVAFANVSRLTHDDFRANSFEELLKSHDKNLEDEERKASTSSLDDLIMLKRQQMKSRKDGK